MVKRSDKTNTGEGDKGKKGKTVSDDVGGKSLIDTSTSVGVKSTTIRTSVNIFESSKRDKSQYFVDKVKDEVHGCGTHTQEFVQITTKLDLFIRVLLFSLSRLRNR
jgi:hypothetical protein